MSYRLIDSNALAQTHPEVNDMPCIYADLDCLDGRHYDLREPSTLQAENAKLRELVRDMYTVMVTDAANCDVTYPEQFDGRMRKLGVEE